MIRNFLGLVLLLVGLYTHADGLRLYTEHYKPFQYHNEEGKVSGFAVDLIHEILARADVDLASKVRIGVWNEAYKRALEESNAGIFMTVRNPAREDLFQWVGPLASRTAWLYKLRSRHDIQANNLDQAKEYLVGTYRSAQSDQLEKLNFPKLDIVLKEELNFKKLLAGRIDLMPSIEIVMLSKLRDKGLPHDTVEKVAILEQGYDFYLALNKNIPSTTVNKLQTALDEFKQSGAYQSLREKYLATLSKLPASERALSTPHANHHE